MKVQKAFSKLTDMVQENFSGIRIIKSFVQEEKEYEKFLEENTNYFDTNMSLVRVIGLFNPLIEFISSLSFVILLGVGGIFVIYGYISLGDFISFNMYLGSLVWPMMAVGWVINNIQRGFVSLERIEKVFHEKPDIFDSNIEKVTSLKGDIIINSLNFAYPGANVSALNDVSIHIKEGETLGLVGESGSGKTTTGRAILRAIEPTEGQVLFNTNGKTIDIDKLNKKELKQTRRDMQMIFQDPYSSLNPRMTVKEIVGEPLLINSIAKGKELEDRVAELMKAVGLRPEYMIRYPHAFSGGQRQRIGIARALSLNPSLLVCDEPVSALDVSIQAQTLNLLQDLQKEFNLTYLFISHDLGVVEHISDRVAVMYVGRIVEITDTEELFENPKHPYTEALLAAVPKPDPKYRETANLLPGEVADPLNPPCGCYFHPRCPYAQDICNEKYPPLVDVGEDGKGHFVACHFADTLN
jgi:peptide/nickel transport system ATP-binding protein